MLTIRLATEQDYDTIVRWNQDRDQAYLLQWSGPGVYRYPLSAEQIARQAGRDGVYLYMACDEKSVVGAGEICVRSETEADICRLIFSERARGKGLGTTFLQALSDIAFGELGLHMLYLRVFCFNVPAIRCYEKAGFRVKTFYEEADSHWNNYEMEKSKQPY